MSATIEGGINSGINSAVGSGASIGTSVGSVREFTSIGSFSPEFSSGGLGVQAFSLSKMLSMPEVAVSAASFSMDTTAPVPEMAMSDKLYHTIATPHPIETPTPVTPFSDLAELQVKGDDVVGDTVVQTDVFDQEIFEVIYQAEQKRTEPQAILKIVALNEPETTVDTFEVADLSPLTNFAAIAPKFEIDFPYVDAHIPNLRSTTPDVGATDNSTFATQIATAENQADTALLQEIERFVEESFAEEPELAAIFEPQIKTALSAKPADPIVATEPQSEAIADTTQTQATEEEQAEVETYVNTEILLPTLVQAAVAAKDEKPEELMPAIPVKEKRWDVYYINHQAQKATVTLKERLKKAREIVQGAFASYTTKPSAAIRAEAAVLDDDKGPKDPQIINFEAPKVADTIADLSDDELADEPTAEFEIEKIIENNAPIVTIAQLQGQASLKFIQLPRAAQDIIMARDAEHLIQPTIGGIYDPTEKLPLINQQEIERDDSPTAIKRNTPIAA